MANALAVKIGLMSKDEELRVKNLLEKYDIPTTYKIKDVEDFYEHFFWIKNHWIIKSNLFYQWGLVIVKSLMKLQKKMLLKY